MIRNLMATTAIAVLLSTAAHAQENAAPAAATPAPAESAAPAVVAAPMARSDAHLASAMIGETVYNGTTDTAENIGKVNDLVIGPKGELQFVVVGVGGFLGLGQKDIAIGFKDISWAERDGDRWLVVPFTKEQLTAQAEFDPRPFEVAPASTAAAPAATTDTMAAAPETDTMAAKPATTTDTTATAAIDKTTLSEMPVDAIRAEDLVGTTVYGANDASVGEIGDVVLTKEGKADAIIIDVGGFLGIGEKEVAVGMDKLAFMTDKDGNKYLYTAFTKEQLEAQTAYNKATWGDQRDQQRMMVQ